jgi:hypothetical protein
MGFRRPKGPLFRRWWFLVGEVSRLLDGERDELFNNGLPVTGVT